MVELVTVSVPVLIDAAAAAVVGPPAELLAMVELVTVRRARVVDAAAMPMEMLWAIVEFVTVSVPAL